MHDMKEDNPDHLREHIKENYIHGSLIYNALDDQGYSAQIMMRYPGSQKQVVLEVKRHLKKNLLT